jgi:hypothetical protein
LATKLESGAAPLPLLIAYVNATFTPRTFSLLLAASFIVIPTDPSSLQMLGTSSSAAATGGDESDKSDTGGVVLGALTPFSPIPSVHIGFHTLFELQKLIPSPHNPDLFRHMPSMGHLAPEHGAPSPAGIDDEVEPSETDDMPTSSILSVYPA